MHTIKDGVAEKVEEVIVADDAMVEKEFSGKLRDSRRNELKGYCGELIEGEDYFLYN